MSSIIKFFDRHESASRVFTALLYAITSAVALNFFWIPGNIYSSGFTGLAQIVNTISNRYMGIDMPISVLIILLNAPLLIMAYIKISKRFALFTTIALVGASISIHYITGPAVPWSTDPLVLAIFGGAVNGFGTGMALRNGISTGGLDIIGIIVRRKTGMRMGAVNLTFNAFIVLTAGFLFGPQFALYTIISLVVNANVLDGVYTRQQQLQVMIVTDKPAQVIEVVQKELRRGITIVHGAEGAYTHAPKEVLFTVISAYERYEFRDALDEADPDAWASTWRIERTIGRFFEPKL